MQELYNQALMCYQQNDYEKALMLLQQCEVSAQTNALMNECKNALKQQYKYVINDAVSSEDNDTLNEYISKYKKLLGEDDYLRSILVTKRENEHVAAEKKMNRNYVIGIVIFVALIAAVVLGSRYGKQTQDNNNDVCVYDTTPVDTLVTVGDGNSSDLEDDKGMSHEVSGKLLVQEILNGTADIFDEGWIDNNCTPRMKQKLIDAYDFDLEPGQIAYGSWILGGWQSGQDISLELYELSYDGQYFYGKLKCSIESEFLGYRTLRYKIIFDKNNQPRVDDVETVEDFR